MGLKSFLKKCKIVEDAKVNLWEKNEKSRIYIEYNNRKFYIQMLGNNKAIVNYHFSNNWTIKDFMEKAGIVFEEDDKARIFLTDTERSE